MQRRRWEYDKTVLHIVKQIKSFRFICPVNHVQRHVLLYKLLFWQFDIILHPPSTNVIESGACAKTLFYSHCKEAF